MSWDRAHLLWWLGQICVTRITRLDHRLNSSITREKPGRFTTMPVGVGLRARVEAKRNRSKKEKVKLLANKIIK